MLAFVANCVVMMIEVAAARILSLRAGNSLYTWTSVIGIVLGGITLGNLVGGRLADRFDCRKLIAFLFLLGAVTSFAVPLLDHAFEEWDSWDKLEKLQSWPLRIALHVTVVFLIPSTCMGLVGPLVAKLALVERSGTGRTVGNVYAAGALGSIAGTFAAGFWLIDWLGTSGVVVGAAGLLGILGTLLAPSVARPFFVVAWPFIVGAAVTFLLPAGPRFYREWKGDSGRLILSDTHAEDEIYRDVSQYAFIRVTDVRKAGTRRLYLDNLLHAVWVVGKDTELFYSYEKIYASVTERFGRGREAIHTLFVGGGGYVFPRYVRARWPRGRIQVVEIDPAVTEADFVGLGLDRAHVRILPRAVAEAPRATGADASEPGAAEEARPMEAYHLDGRNHVEDLLKLRRDGSHIEPFDFIYGDAFNDFSVPFHLVTIEFAEKLKALLRPRTGLYLMNIIDIYASGKFLGAIYNTLRKTFPNVYILSTLPNSLEEGVTQRDTFIVIGALEALDLEGLGTREGETPFSGELLKEEHLRLLEQRSGGLVLTDDFSPVENLLEPVVRHRGDK